MKEFSLLLWAMTASHHQWPMPPERPAAVRVLERERKPSPEETERLRAAIARAAACATGRVAADHETGLYVPEKREGCDGPAIK